MPIQQNLTPPVLLFSVFAGWDTTSGMILKTGIFEYVKTRKNNYVMTNFKWESKIGLKSKISRLYSLKPPMTLKHGMRMNANFYLNT